MYMLEKSTIFLLAIWIYSTLLITPEEAAKIISDFL
jgi:hypothetical protein